MQVQAEEEEEEEENFAAANRAPLGPMAIAVRETRNREKAMDATSENRVPRNQSSVGAMTRSTRARAVSVRLASRSLAQMSLAPKSLAQMSLAPKSLAPKSLAQMSLAPKSLAQTNCPDKGRHCAQAVRPRVSLPPPPPH
jgi:hypothetical protein